MNTWFVENSENLEMFMLLCSRSVGDMVRQEPSERINLFFSLSSCIQDGHFTTLSCPPHKQQVPNCFQSVSCFSKIDTYICIRTHLKGITGRIEKGESGL